jgi:hypothetical protein
VTFPRRGKNIKENCWRKLADYLRLIRLQIFTAGGGLGAKRRIKTVDLTWIGFCPAPQKARCWWKLFAVQADL